MKLIIQRVIDTLQLIIAHLQKIVAINNESSASPLTTLAPKVLTQQEDLVKIRPYLDNLKLALDEKGINNIAITGSYGSGKSTIIKTFRHLNPQYNYLNISLASFAVNKNTEETLDRRLEISILQQMFYHVEPSVIPDSRFKRINNTTKIKLFGYSAFFVLWILSGIFLFHFNYIDRLNPSIWSIDQSINLIVTISSAIFFSGILFMATRIYRTFSNSRINKLNIQGELELGDNTDKSIFNQHLEEILYFFERTDFNVVVIEDVDRFDNTDIFAKLREINILINNSNLINRPIKFVYAIRDEMFKNRNQRVKFFEFIIPIVPFINPSNANDQLAKLISKAKLQNELTSDFTSDIVTAIDDIDMRLLINIFQEYEVYRRVLSPSLKPDNLFAILVYKNIDPEDFGLLSKRKGKLYTFLTNKRSYSKSVRDKLNSRIENIDAEIATLEITSTRSVKELRSVYVNHLVNAIDKFHRFYFEKEYSIIEATEDEVFDKIKKSDNIMYLKFEPQNNVTFRISGPKICSIKFSDIEKAVSSEFSYDEREKSIVDKLNNKVNVLKTGRAGFKKKLRDVESQSIAEIFNEVDISEYLKEFEDSYLMRNLLINGYIDEHFEDYISLFHEGSLTKDDYHFERSVKGSSSLPPDYKLSHIGNLVKRIPDKYFKRQAAWNYELLDFLLDNQSTYPEKTETLFSGLVADEERQFDFIYGYTIRESDHKALFIKNLCIRKPGLWNYISSKSNLSDGEVRNLLALIFEHADLKSILEFENVTSLVTYLEEIPDILSFCSSIRQTSTITAFVLDKEVRFKKLEAKFIDTDEVFNFIYEHDLYELNPHNISTIIQGNSPRLFNIEELTHSHYTTVRTLNLDHLTDYIDNNIEEYILDVLLLLRNNKHESEETLLELLNREDVPIELKEKLLKSQNTLIQTLEPVEDTDVRELLLAENFLVPSWDNVLMYFNSLEDQKLDEILVSYLNEQPVSKALSSQKVPDDFDTSDDVPFILSLSIIESGKLDNEAYGLLVKSITYEFEEINFDDLDGIKVSALLDENLIEMTLDNFKSIKAKYSSLMERFIELRQDDFVLEFEDYSLETSDWFTAFESNINAENLKHLLENMDDSIIENNNELAGQLCEIMPYDTFIPLRYEVLQTMFNSNGDIPIRVALLNFHFSQLTNEQVQSLTASLGTKYAALFKRMRKPKFKKTDSIMTLIEELKRRRLISSYKFEGGGVRVFAKY